MVKNQVSRARKGYTNIAPDKGVDKLGGHEELRFSLVLAKL